MEFAELTKPADDQKPPSINSVPDSLAKAKVLQAKVELGSVKTTLTVEPGTEFTAYKDESSGKVVVTTSTGTTK